MFDIPFHINLQFISLIELKHPLKTSNKKTLLYLFVSIIEIEHPLKHQKSTHVYLK